MNKLLVIFGFGILSNAPILEGQTNQTELPVVQTVQTTEHSLRVLNISAFELATEVEIFNGASGHIAEEVLDSRDIHFLDVEEHVALGFDTSDYLPEGFNPYVKNFDITSVSFSDVDNDLTIGFDTTGFLPEDFNAYAGDIPIETLQFMEDDTVDLDFDTAAYLPEGFNAYEVYFDISEITFLEEPLEHLNDFNCFLPANFNAYSETVNMDSIHFMEDEEIEMDFNTKVYLPEGFDPYQRSM